MTGRGEQGRSETEPLALLYVALLHTSSGGQVHASSFVRAMQELGVDLHLLSLAPPEVQSSGQLKSNWLLARMAPYVRDLWLMQRDGKAVPALLAEIERVRPRALLVRDAPMCTAARRVSRRLDLPYFLEVNAPLSLETARHSGPGLAGIAFRRERANWEGARAVFCVSEVLRTYLLNHSSVSPSRVVVVPNGVDMAPFAARDPEQGRLLRRTLGFAPFPEATVFCFSGTLQPWHGCEAMVEAFADLPPRAAAIIIGEGKQSEQVRRRIADLGLTRRVLMVGRVRHEEMSRYLAACDAAVMPYPMLEPFYFSPLKMFEYLAAGLPIVASGQGQIAELLEDGTHGLVYPPDPPGECARLRQALDRFLALTELGAMQEANRQLARRYTWRVNAEKILAVVRGALGSDHIPSPSPGQRP